MFDLCWTGYEKSLADRIPSLSRINNTYKAMAMQTIPVEYLHFGVFPVPSNFPYEILCSLDRPA